jgi:hypothetical protein
MEPLKQINNLDIKINSLRLELIRIIADINRMVSTNNAKTRANEYNALKKKYYDTNQEIESLSAEKTKIQAQSGAKQAA